MSIKGLKRRLFSRCKRGPCPLDCITCKSEIMLDWHKKEVVKVLEELKEKVYYTSAVPVALIDEKIKEITKEDK